MYERPTYTKKINKQHKSFIFLEPLERPVTSLEPKTRFALGPFSLFAQEFPGRRFFGEQHASLAAEKIAGRGA